MAKSKSLAGKFNSDEMKIIKKFQETHYQYGDTMTTEDGLDFINEKYRLNLPVKEDYETLGGMIIHYAETIPEKGASFLIDTYEVVVLEVEENKIVKVGLKISVKD